MHDQIFILKDAEVATSYYERECPQAVLRLNLLICHISAILGSLLVSFMPAVTKLYKI